jgi:hypothetical protein
MKKKHLFSWSNFWEGITSAVVADAAPTKIVMTFDSGRPIQGCDADQFAITSDVHAKAISELEWEDDVLTITSDAAFVHGEGITVVFSLKKANSSTFTTEVTNNIEE